jgi:hypothetical protein
MDRHYYTPKTCPNCKTPKPHFAPETKKIEEANPLYDWNCEVCGGHKVWGTVVACYCTICHTTYRFQFPNLICTVAPEPLEAMKLVWHDWKMPLDMLQDHDWKEAFRLLKAKKDKDLYHQVVSTEFSEEDKNRG